METDGPPALSFAQINANALNLIEGYVDANGLPANGLTRATEAQIPDMGTIRYQGQFLGDVSGRTVIGDVTLDVQLLTSTVDGTGTNFVHETEGALAGTLTGTGNISQAAGAGVPQVAVVLDGQITRGGTAQSTTIALDGDFYANESDGVGAIAGPAEGSLGSDTIQNGLFGVQRR